MNKGKKRFWSDDEKREICGQTLLTNVSVGYPGQHDPIYDLARFIFDLDEGNAP